MVLADVDENTHGRIERGREVDLIGRDLDYVRATAARRLERQDRRAEIAADLSIVAGMLQEIGGQRRGGGFAVGAGDRDERRAGRLAASLAAEQLDVADHLDTRGVR